MAVETIRRGRGFHKRRHRPNIARAESAKTVVRETVKAPPLFRRQGKGKDGKGVAPPPPPPAPPAPPGVTTSSSLTTSTAVTSVQTIQTSVQTQTTVITTAQTSTQVSTQVTTITASPSSTAQTSLLTASTTSNPFIASTPYQAAPSNTTSPAAASRAPTIAPGTIAGIVVGILSFFFIILGAVCLCSRRTRQRLLTPVTRRFTNNSMFNSGSRGIDSVRRPSGRGGDMHKSLMSEAESMAYTASPVDVKPQMATVQPSRGLSQNPVFMAPYSRPNSWRTWRPSATFAQGLEPLPDDIQLPPPPPHALTRNSAFPRTSEVSTGADSSMPEYAWHTASNADLTGLAPAPAQALAPEYVAGPHEPAQDYLQQIDGHGSYVTYSDTPLATPRTPMVVEAERTETPQEATAGEPEVAAAAVEPTNTNPRAAFKKRSWAGRLERVAAMAAARKGSRRSHRASKASRRSKGSRTSRASVASKFSRKSRRSKDSQASG